MTNYKWKEKIDWNYHYSAVACTPEYKSIANGVVICMGNTYEDKCSFSCNAGYQLVGYSVLTCISDGNDADGYGEWDEMPPTCQGIICALCQSYELN